MRLTSTRIVLAIMIPSVLLAVVLGLGEAMLRIPIDQTESMELAEFDVRGRKFRIPRAYLVLRNQWLGEKTESGVLMEALLPDLGPYTQEKAIHYQPGGDLARKKVSFNIWGIKFNPGALKEYFEPQYLATCEGEPALSEEALKKRMAADRDYWRSGPAGDAKRWWYATEYRFAFPDDQDRRTARADCDWARRQDDLPAELPEGGFVFSRNAVRAFGANLLGRLNAAGLVENAQALTQVRRAIAEAQGRRLKLTPKELKAMQMDPRSWRDLDRKYIDRIADEYRHSYGG